MPWAAGSGHTCTQAHRHTCTCTCTAARARLRDHLASPWGAKGHLLFLHGHAKNGPLPASAGGGASGACPGMSGPCVQQRAAGQAPGRRRWRRLCTLAPLVIIHIFRASFDSPKLGQRAEGRGGRELVVPAARKCRVKLAQMPAGPPLWLPKVGLGSDLQPRGGAPGTRSRTRSGSRTQVMQGRLLGLAAASPAWPSCGLLRFLLHLPSACGLG